MPPAQTAASHTRRTIGVFSAQLSRVWGSEFISGVMDAAEAADVNVVCFVGGKALALPGFDDKKTSYGLYDVVKPGQLDGLLLTADLVHGLSPDDAAGFCRAFSFAPMVAQAIQADHVPSLMADSLQGMRLMIRHLIETHGYKRIAFIRGPRAQIEADLRFQAYQEELKAHAIRYDEKLIVDGDFTPESGRAAVRTLMDERGLRFQALAASNDRMAFGAMDALQARGIRVPDNVALTGFDDVREAQSMGVPLTTVRQPFYEAGRQAFEFLMKRINGEAVPPLTLLPTSLVIRWSCGCLPESVQRAVVLPKEVARTGRLENKRDAAIKALCEAADVPARDPQVDQFKDVFGRLWDVLLACLREEKSSEYLKMMQTSIEVMQRHGRDAAAWHNVISTLRKHALGGITDQAVALKAENLFQQARMLAGEISQRAQAYRRLEIEQQEELLGGFGFSMAPAMSLEAIGEAVAKHFPAMGIERWYLMFYSDISAPRPISAPPPENYRLLLQYDNEKFEIRRQKARLTTGRLTPRGKMPEDHRYSAVVMPLTLARNRFGFMWAEMGPRDWEVYVRVRNLISSALLRAMLVQQREQAQKEVERLLEEARQRAEELALARDAAEKAAQENARMYESEQSRRRAVELMAQSSRQLSTLSKVDEVPQQILEQLSSIIQFDRGLVFLEDVNGVPHVAAYRGLPAEAALSEIRYYATGEAGPADMYNAVARMKEPIYIGDVTRMNGWSQPAWLPMDHSWLGLPLFYKNKVMGMVVVTRQKAWAFNRDDAAVTRAFAVQAAIALENAKLYNEVTSINQMMERMVSQRVEELNNAYRTLEKLDKNKSAFIQIAAHELRTPLTVIKGYLGMLKADPAVASNSALSQAVEGVARGAERLHQIVNSMLDAARLESQTVIPHLESVSLAPILRLIQKDYAADLAARSLTFELDASINTVPPLLADPQLLQKALDQIIVNSIKFTPDGGTVTVYAESVKDESLGPCAEIRIKDTGIGIDPGNQKIIFEKLYQLGKVEFHSSSRTAYKGGGPGLGLAIAAGIIKAHQGRIWVESEGYDEEKLPGSTFFIRIPLAK
jgi:signal transduction histidine kinase/DNA-binding LacI/PurR family transcriptional regulator